MLLDPPSPRAEPGTHNRALVVNSTRLITRSEALTVPDVPGAGMTLADIIDPQRAPPTPALPPFRSLPTGRPLRVLGELNGVSPRLLPPASEFDQRHYNHTKNAIRALEVSTQAVCPDTATLFTSRIRAIQRNRYLEPHELQVIVRHEVRRKQVVVKQWCLEESIWQKRSAWSDSGTFLDTVEMYVTLEHCC